MRTIFTILAASTALAGAIAIPAWSAMRGPAGNDALPVTAVFAAERNAPTIILASDREDDDRRGDERSATRIGGNDDEDNDDDCEGDDGGCNAAANPAPAGTVAPPKNGLFGTGAPPKVQVK